MQQGLEEQQEEEGQQQAGRRGSRGRQQGRVGQRQGVVVVEVAATWLGLVLVVSRWRSG
jgi:hypothetical protein